MINKTLFSIIIVNFNGKDYLVNCINSILKNNFDSYEIIVVDNNSSDNSINAIKSKFKSQISKIKIITLNQNFGPAKARNEGTKIAKGKYLGFLDNDTEVSPNWISEAYIKFQKNPKIGALQCKLLSFTDRNKIDYVGEYLSNFGFLVQISKYNEIDYGQYDNYTKILAAKSAAMFIKKNTFQLIKGFDERYFIFLEETDLGWRTWLSGKEVHLCPKSVVYHHFSATKNIVDKNFNNYLIRFHGTKNYIYTLYKNLSFKYLIKILPVHIFLWLCLFGYLLTNGKFQSATNILKGILWNFINLKQNTKNRICVQKNRKTSDNTLFNELKLLKSKNISYFLNKFNNSQKEVVTSENTKS